MRIPYARSLAGLFSPGRRMREDWDLRARRNARLFIDCGHGATEEGFWRSGEEDLRDYVLRDLELDSSAQVLEIGCGIGRLLRPLSERVSTATGADISGEMVRRGREALADRGNVRFERTDGDLAFASPASLDLVYSHSVFQHVPDREAVLRYFDEAARVLKSGGIFRFQVDGRPGTGIRRPGTWFGIRWTGTDVRRELEKRGFDVVDLSGEGTQFLWVTARRRAEAARAASSTVRARPRAWNLEALDALLGRLGAGSERDRVVAGVLRLRELAGPLVASRRRDPPRAYVAAVYRALLGREPDPEGLAFYAGEIESGSSRTHVVDCLLASAEFDAKHRLPGRGLNRSFTRAVRR